MSVLDVVNKAKAKTEEQLSRGGGRSAAGFWKPSAGENKIRVMPQWRDDLGGQFWREVAQHWNVGDDQRGPVLCPQETPGMDGDCPICDLVKVLKADKNNPEAQRLFKDIRAKRTYFLNVIVQKDPVYTAGDVAEYMQTRPGTDCPFEAGDPKIQIYACPITIFDNILGIINTSKKDITDLVTGRNVILKKIPNKDPLKTRYECLPELDESDTGLKNPDLPALDKVGFELDYNEMVALLSSGRAADYVSSSSSSNGSSNSLSSGTQKPLASSDLEELMRHKLSV